MSTLTYLQFHGAFLVPALTAVAIAAAVARRRPGTGVVRPSGVALMAVVAVAYTAPWDVALIRRGVWWYAEGAVAGTLYGAPLEEYLFMLLQPILVALWLHFATRRLVADDDAPLALAPRRRALGAAAGMAVGVAGVAMLAAGPRTLYIGAILAWAAPVLALQWAVGWHQLWRRRRTVTVGVAVPTAYLWVVDRIAIGDGVWVVSPAYTTGWTVAGLPVEEAVFFLVTTLFVVQGLLLYDWVLRRWPERTEAPSANRFPARGDD